MYITRKKPGCMCCTPNQAHRTDSARIQVRRAMDSRPVPSRGSSVVRPVHPVEPHTEACLSMFGPFCLITIYMPGVMSLSSCAAAFHQDVSSCCKVHADSLPSKYLCPSSRPLRTHGDTAHEVAASPCPFQIFLFLFPIFLLKSIPLQGTLRLPAHEAGGGGGQAAGSQDGPARERARPQDGCCTDSDAIHVFR